MPPKVVEHSTTVRCNWCLKDVSESEVTVCPTCGSKLHKDCNRRVDLPRDLTHITKPKDPDRCRTCRQV